MGPEFRYVPPPVAVSLVRRLHRFGAIVRDPSGRSVLAHVPNPGRMRELLRPGARGWMVPSEDPRRRTVGTLVALRHGRTLVSIDTQLPNQLVAKRLAAPGGPGSIGAPAGVWRPEYRYGHSRFDFGLLREPSGPPVALFEVKSANLRVGREAWFPDAPTVRGTRHVLELARAARSDIRAGVLFVVQRGDVQAVRPHHRMDPAFADACIEAADVGVHFSAVRLILRPGGASLGARLPVRGLGKAPKMSM